ncbi:hypothetical protein BG004_007741 [Podila humilis]|nr:hypothetical protein BG004_007741 [Podila humilis]
MIFSNLLSSRRHRRFILTLLVIAICSFVTFTLYQPRPYWKHRTQDAPYGLDTSKQPITQENHRWKGKTQAAEIYIPDSTWTCTEDEPSEEDPSDNNNESEDDKDKKIKKKAERNERTKQCVIENLCVDRQGAFIRTSDMLFPKNLPKINLMSADPEADVYWQPRVERSWRKVTKAHYVNETLFVHGLYSPYHFSHWLYNGMMPLYSTMKRFGATKDSWTMRAARFAWDDIKRQGDWEMDHFFYTGKELVLTQYELATDFQTLPPSDAPICFKRAVIGLGSQCALDYCERNIPTEVYQSFRDEIADHYWKTPETWSRHLAESKDKINHPDPSQKMADYQNSKDRTPLKCLDIARYYNFEGTGPNHTQEEKGEHLARVGQLFPEIANQAKDYLFFKADGGTSAAAGTTLDDHNRRLVVGIIQRESSRRIINDQELIDGLVKAGFRVKWMSFDHGCGLAETAYLLRDVNVLISPHGNAIGTSIFMPTYDPVPTIISVDNARYSEPWFKYTASSLGQRFTSNACGPSNYPDEDTKKRCPFFRDEIGGRKLLEKSNMVLGIPASMAKSEEAKQKMTLEERAQWVEEQREFVAQSPEAQALAVKEFEMLIGPEVSSELVSKYTEDYWSFNGNLWKAIPRYIDVPRIVKFTQELQSDFEKERAADDLVAHGTTSPSKTFQQQRHFIDYVRQNRACGVDWCKAILQRNVASMRDGAFGKHSIDDTSRWNQPTAESATLLEGLTNLDVWPFKVDL